MNTLLNKQVEVVEVVEVVVKAPVRKPQLRPWVKVAAKVVVLGTIGLVGAGILDVATVSQDELASKVTWVDAYAHDGDGYERMVRRANGDRPLDIKTMSYIMQDKNHDASLKAGVVYHVPVLEAK